MGFTREYLFPTILVLAVLAILTPLLSPVLEGMFGVYAYWAASFVSILVALWLWGKLRRGR